MLVLLSALVSFFPAGLVALAAGVGALLHGGMATAELPPEPHPVAPSHIPALMSGVMLKVAIYSFIRFVFNLPGDVFWQ